MWPFHSSPSLLSNSAATSKGRPLDLTKFSAESLEQPSAVRNWLLVVLQTIQDQHELRNAKFGARTALLHRTVCLVNCLPNRAFTAHLIRLNQVKTLSINSKCQFLHSSNLLSRASFSLLRALVFLAQCASISPANVSICVSKSTRQSFKHVTMVAAVS